MLFSQLNCSDSVKNNLRRMVETRALPPVLLIHGSSEENKKALAEELARHLLGSTVALDKNPDLHQLFPDKNGQHSIASIRELIEETSLPPYSSPAKVFIIHNAEMMQPASSNALLKTLEEPPASTWFFLLAGDVGAMLSTILSRCRVIRLAGASLENQDDPKTALLIDMMRSGLEEGTWPSMLQKLDELLKEEEDPEDSLFTPILSWMRDLALLQAGASSKKIFYQEHRETLQNQAKRAQPVPLTKVYALIEKAEARLAFNMRPVSLLEEVFIQLQKLIKTV